MSDSGHLTPSHRPGKLVTMNFAAVALLAIGLVQIVGALHNLKSLRQDV